MSSKSACFTADRLRLLLWVSDSITEMILTELFLMCELFFVKQKSRSEIMQAEWLQSSSHLDDAKLIIQSWLLDFSVSPEDDF